MAQPEPSTSAQAAPAAAASSGPSEAAIASLMTQVQQGAPPPVGTRSGARPVRKVKRTDQDAAKAKKKAPSKSGDTSAAPALVSTAGDSQATVISPATTSLEPGKPEPIEKTDDDKTAEGHEEPIRRSLDKPVQAASAAPQPPPVGAPRAQVSSEKGKARALPATSEKATKGKKKKRSIWVVILAAVVPCVSIGAEKESKARQAKDKPATQTREKPGPPSRDMATPPTPYVVEKDPNASTDSKQSSTESTQKHLGESMQPEIVAANSPQGVQLPRDETEGVLSGAVQSPGSDGTPDRASLRKKKRKGASARSSRDNVAGALAGSDSEAESSHKAEEETSDQLTSDEDEEIDDDDDEEIEDDRLLLLGGMGIPMDSDGNLHPLLSELGEIDKGRKCLVLDLDETLVHSSFKMIHQADFIVPVEIENQVHNVYVIKRPGVDHFLQKMGELYEVVVFTASLSKYADPVLDILDIHRVVRHRLFRESCYNHNGNYVKDLSQLGRPIGETIIIDNSPASYIFHPNNAVPVSSWFNDPHDTELTDLVPFLTDLQQVDDVRGVLDGGLSHGSVVDSMEKKLDSA
ncbi:uncharacterized protein L969DRAFT_18392 [Mixia osmundae IAM 14324]|nr:uncharacterized protein L969DRAFT_18392 [Mixia osmundae IAM 14324]KEI38378.1 hypothetical protein L969DRAFT_18392 [Mixia osmundae IAM 14324]